MSVDFTIQETLIKFFKASAFSVFDWRSVVMILISFVLFYLAIKKDFEPLLLVPIAFGMMLANIPLAGLMNEPVYSLGADGLPVLEHIGGLLYYLYQGDALSVFPPLIFMGIGAMTDFGPLIANSKSLFIGAAAQLGVFIAFFLALLVHEFIPGITFTPAEAASIGIIGGADGPVVIYLATKLAPHLLGPLAVAAYSYMALVPVILPPVAKALTTKKERQIMMTQLYPVSKTTKIIFPIMSTVLVSIILPEAASLVGMLMVGNLFRECGVTERLSDVAQNALINMLTIFLGISVGATANGQEFLTPPTIAVFVLGCLAFAGGAAGGVLLCKLMNLFCKNKVNPLLGLAGVSAVPMSARVAHKMGQEANPKNFLIMHAMGPNVAGVIGTSVAAAMLLTMFG